MGIGLAQELGIELLDLGVVVGLAQLLTLILGVQGGGTLGPEGVLDVVVLMGQEAGADDGLAAACDTAAGAAHDLDEVVLGAARTDLVQQDLGVLHAVGDGHVDGHTVQLDGSLTDALEATHLLELDGLVLLAGQDEVDGAQGSLHNAAGDAEDDAGAGVLAHQILVELLVRETLEEDTGTLDHAGQLPGGQNGIHIPQTIHIQLLTLGLVLLGGAGHDGDHEDVLGVDALLFGIVGLEDGTLHLVGRLAGGQVGQQVAVVILGVVDPAGRAGGDHGQDAAAANTAQQLGALLHDGQVGGEVGVVDLVEAQTLQSGDHLAGDGSADGHAELLAQGCTDGGGSLDHHMLAGLEGGIHLGDLGLLHQSAGGTDADTLAALDAGGVDEGAVLGGGHDGVEATVLKAQNAHAVGILAPGHAAAAEDALGGVPDDGGGDLVEGGGGLGTLIAALPGTGQVGHVQQLALAVLVALLAVNVMIGQQQLHGSPAGLAGLGAGNDDLHALVDGVDTGGDQASCALDLHQTDTAGTIGALAVVKSTEAGDLVAALLGGLQDGQALFDLIGNAFNLNIHHFRFLLTS